MALIIYRSLVYPFYDGHSFVQVVAFKKGGLILIRTVSSLVLGLDSSVWCVLVDGSSHITAVVLVVGVSDGISAGERGDGGSGVFCLLTGLGADGRGHKDTIPSAERPTVGLW